MRHLFFLLFTVFTFAQQTQKVDFKTVTGNITIDPIAKKVQKCVLKEFLWKDRTMHNC